jgi:hypothetical protein
MPTCGGCHVAAIAVAHTASAVRDLGVAGAVLTAAASALGIGYKRRRFDAPVARSAASDADADQTKRATTEIHTSSAEREVRSTGSPSGATKEECWRASSRSGARSGARGKTRRLRFETAVRALLPLRFRDVVMIARVGCAPGAVARLAARGMTNRAGAVHYHEDRVGAPQSCVPKARDHTPGAASRRAHRRGA